MGFVSIFGLYFYESNASFLYMLYIVASDFFMMMQRYNGLLAKKRGNCFYDANLTKLEHRWT
jgi:hypothetical protein